MATYYVNNLTGENTNDGSQSAPFETLAHVWSIATAEDNVVIAGTGVDYTVPVTSSKFLNLYGEDPTTTRLVTLSIGSTLWGPSTTITEINIKNVTIKVNGSISEIFTSDSFAVNGAGYPLNITNVVFDLVNLSFSSLVYVWNPAAVTFRNCVFSFPKSDENNIRWPSVALFYLRAVGYGEEGWLKFYNCIFYVNGNPTGSANSKTIIRSDWDSRIIVKNCIFKGNGSGVFTAFLLTFPNPPSTSLVSNLCINGVGVYNPAVTALSTEAYITDDPLFLDLSNETTAENNYNLSPISPCLGRGVFE